MTHDASTVLETSDWAALSPAPLVSVVMTAYNHGPYLARAIEGVVRQRTSFPIELLIADDTSPDDTFDVAREYQRRHPDIVRIVTGPVNIGGRANFRRVATRIRGRYVAFCEGDDFWTDDGKLARQVALFDASPRLSMACHSVALFDDMQRDGPHRTHRITRRSRLLSRDELILGDGALVPTCSILVRADLFDDRPQWWENAPIGDYPLVLRAMQAGDVAYEDRVMGAYRINVRGSWSTRHVPELARRKAHAECIVDMLHGFLAADGARSARAVRSVASKYWFDVIVRTQGTPAERRAVFDARRAQMTFADRWIARASLATSRNLGWLRTPGKRLAAFVLRARNDATQPRLDAGAA